MHATIEGPHEDETLGKKATAAFGAMIAQIILIDMVFSVDSIITAVGMADHVEVMIAAVIVAVGIMFAASGPIARFVAAHPTTKMLALAFLLLIGVSLVADGLGFHIPKGYIYSAMAFAVLVEAFNILAAQRRRQRDGGPQAMAHVSTGTMAAEAAGAVTTRPKSTPASRAQSRPKSARRKK
jgi:predicted tellurium resistance membrane protein TerC